MSVIPCLGVLCHQRHQCKGYEAVNGSDPQNLRLDYCATRVDGTRVRFQPIRAVPDISERRKAA